MTNLILKCSTVANYIFEEVASINDGKGFKVQELLELIGREAKIEGTNLNNFLKNIH